MDFLERRIISLVSGMIIITLLIILAKVAALFSLLLFPELVGSWFGEVVHGFWTAPQ